MDGTIWGFRLIFPFSFIHNDGVSREKLRAGSEQYPFVRRRTSQGSIDSFVSYTERKAEFQVNCDSFAFLFSNKLDAFKPFFKCLPFDFPKTYSIDKLSLSGFPVHEKKQNQGKNDAVGNSCSFLGVCRFNPCFERIDLTILNAKKLNAWNDYDVLFFPHLQSL